MATAGTKSNPTLKGWSLSAKILLLFAVLVVLMQLALFLYFNNKLREAGIAEHVHEAMGICLTAEGVMEVMEDKWTSEYYTLAQARAIADAKDLDQLLAMVPVVNAWRVAEIHAEEADYAFKTPKFQPRNEKNEPNEVEAAALKQLEAEKLTELVVIDEEINSIRYFRPIYLTASCLMCHGDPAKSMEYWGTSDGTDPTGDKMENWKVGELHGAFEVIKSLDEIDEQAIVHFRNGLLMTALGLVITIVLFGFAIKRAISKPITDVSRSLQEMALGNMTVSLPAALTSRGDEIGMMSTAMNDMSSQLRTSLADVSHGVSTLVSSSSSLTNISKSMTTSSAETSDRASMVAAASEEMSANTISVAAGMEQTASNLQSVATATEEMTATIGEIAHNSERARQTTDHAVSQADGIATTMHELGVAAQEIGKVTEAITSISAQTNLLALNATIEAARAGAAGKGFAVVANEIKELAQQTAAATEDIKSKIVRIQESTGGAVSEVKGIANIIREVSEIVTSIATAIEEQSVVTKDIAGNIAQATHGVRDANERVAQTSSVAQSVAQDIAGVSVTGQSMSRSSEEVMASAAELSRLAEQLQSLVSRFKI